MVETYNYGGKSLTSRECGNDYLLIYEYTCTECHYSWRLGSKPQNAQCPKCRSIKLYYVSKRSCDDEVSDEIVIPQESELL